MNPSVVHCADRSLEGDISFHLTLQPLVFLRLLTWGKSCPLPVLLRCAQGDAVSHAAKAGKTRGADANRLHKEAPPVTGFKSTVQTVHGKGVFLFT